MSYAVESSEPSRKAWRLLVCLGAALCFSSCSLVPEIKINPITLDIPLSGSGHDWELPPMEKPDKPSGFVERIVRRIAGPPTIMAGMTLEYRAIHGKWPATVEDLDANGAAEIQTLKRIKSATFTPKEGDAVELSMLYDSNIPANILLTVERASNNS